MTTSTTSGDRGPQHAKASPKWRTPAIVAALIVPVGLAATLAVGIGGHGASHNDPLGKAVAGIASSRQARILAVDAALARNCTEPVVKLPQHGTLAMVYPGQLTAGLVGSDAIESYSPTQVTLHGFTTFTWTMNPLQKVVKAFYAVRTAPGQCSTALHMQIRHVGKFSLGNGKTMPFLVLVARVLRGTTLAWASIVAANMPAK